MNWYMSKLIFRITCGDGNHVPQFDEQLRLVYATSEAEALTKSIEIGRREQDSFPNANGELVVWRFIEVTELYSLHSMNDGVEICSRVQEAENGEAYVDLIRDKADGLRSRLHLNAVEAV